MNSFASKLLTAISGLLLLIYAVYQGYRYVYSPYSTEIAVNYAYQSIVSAKGVAMREEHSIGDRPSGVIGYLYEDSDKVSAHTAVARIFGSEEDVITQAGIAKTQKQIDSLRQAQNLSAGAYSNTETLIGQMYEEYGKLLGFMSSGKMLDAQGVRDRYLELLNRYRIKTGKEENYLPRINQLEQRKAQLQQSLHTQPQNITVSSGGYFSESTDGLEKVILASEVDRYTQEELQAFMELPAQNNHSIGKIVDTFDWYFAAVIPTEQFERFLGVTTVTLDFHLPNTQPVPASVYKLMQNRDGKESIVIFNCKELYGELINLRTQNVDIKLGTIRGVRVNSRAVRFVDGQSGVYLRNGFTIHFRPVRVLYEEAAFAICDPEFGDNPLKQYDEIIVDGDVYDGKTLLG